MPASASHQRAGGNLYGCSLSLPTGSYQLGKGSQLFLQEDSSSRRRLSCSGRDFIQSSLQLSAARRRPVPQLYASEKRASSFIAREQRGDASQRTARNPDSSSSIGVLTSFPKTGFPGSAPTVSADSCAALSAEITFCSGCRIVRRAAPGGLCGQLISC